MDLIRVVSGMAVNAHGEILMGLRKPDRFRPNLWELPGGKTLGYSEGDITALKREWKEELDVEIDVTHNDWIATDKLVVEVEIDIVLFNVRLLGQPQQVDHAELRWVKPEDAVQRLPCSPGYYIQYDSMMRWLKGEH